MSPRRHALVAALASAAVACVAQVAQVGLSAPSARADEPDDAGAVQVTDARFAWAVNNESNNKAFAPGTFNFLTAGQVPDPGQGDQTIVAPGVWKNTTTRAWAAQDGAVTLQKRQPDNTYATSRYADLGTDVDGRALTSTTGPFSGQRIVIDDGVGTVDPAAGTATIGWTGSFSVVYYSGYTFFTVTDPVLTVTPTSARVQAEVRGYGSSRLDTTVWKALPPATLTLADLPREDIDLTGPGFSLLPAFQGVTYDAKPGSEPQLRSGAGWGSFPTDLVDYLDDAGGASFWYSSGGGADRHKVPTALTVAFDADVPVTPSGPTDGPTGPTELPTTTVKPPPPTNTAPTTTPPITTTPTTATPSTPTSATLPTGQPSTPAPVGPAPAPAPPAGGPPTAPPAVPPLVSTPVSMNGTVEVVARAATPSLPAEGSDRRWTWWLGSALLLAAAALIALGTPSKGHR